MRTPQTQEELIAERLKQQRLQEDADLELAREALGKIGKKYLVETDDGIIVIESYRLDYKIDFVYDLGVVIVS